MQSSALVRGRFTLYLMTRMRKRLTSAVWILAFIGLVAFWTHQVVLASRPAPPPVVWVCPIAGNCGPAGTPGLGRWP
jgi:hypothetical protein